MKKTIRIVALCLLVLTLLCIFGSCGKSVPNAKPSMEEIDDVISVMKNDMNEASDQTSQTELDYAKINSSCTRVKLKQMLGTFTDPYDTLYPIRHQWTLEDGKILEVWFGCSGYDEFQHKWEDGELRLPDEETQISSSGIRFATDNEIACLKAWYDSFKAVYAFVATDDSLTDRELIFDNRVQLANELAAKQSSEKAFVVNLGNPIKINHTTTGNETLEATWLIDDTTLRVTFLPANGDSSETYDGWIAATVKTD